MTCEKLFNLIKQQQKVVNRTQKLYEINSDMFYIINELDEMFDIHYLNEAFVSKNGYYIGQLSLINENCRYDINLMNDGILRYYVYLYETNTEKMFTNIDDLINFIRSFFDKTN